MIPLSEMIAARERIAPHIRETPLTFDPELGVAIKWENHQVTGSFKPRGALNKVLSLTDDEVARGLIACSAGNHGQGLALAARVRGAAVTVYASEHASPLKIDKMRALGAGVTLVPGGYGEAEAAALEAAERTGCMFVSPYDDRQVIAGAGTIALEVNEQSWTRAVLVPVGGGGLLAGVGSACKGIDPAIRVVAIQNETSAFLHAEFHGHGMDSVCEDPSLADGLSGAVDPRSQTIPLMHEVADDFLLVSEEEIARAITYAFRVHGEVIEGAAAVGLGAVLAGKLEPDGGGATVILVTGGNIDAERHRNLAESDRIQSSRR